MSKYSIAPEAKIPSQLRGYPVLSTGFYTRDPAFGDLVRRALKLGYRIVPYEPSYEQLRPKTEDRSPADLVNRRERLQANNIHKRVFSKDPAAKVLVIGARGHIAESAAPCAARSSTPFARPLVSLQLTQLCLQPTKLTDVGWNRLVSLRRRSSTLPLREPALTTLE